MQNGKPYDGGFPQRLPIFTLSKRFTLQIKPYYTKKLNIIEISIKTKSLYIGYTNNEIISCCAKF